VKDRNGRITVPKGECQIVRQACGVCPDCILYGSVVTSGRRVGSQRSRVLTDSGFVVRGVPQVVRNVKLNAIAETTNGGIVSGAYSHRENLMPEIFLPTVETLVDVTEEEFVYVMGNILKTTRYGAESGREGFVRNHIAGVYFSDVEVFSNLEMSQLFYDILSTNGSIPDSLSLRDFTINLAEVTDECMKKAFGRITMMTDEEISELIRDIRTIYSDQQSLREFLRTLSKMSMTYANQMRNSKDERYALVEM
jgi:CRISPR-associated protein Csc2